MENGLERLIVFGAVYMLIFGILLFPFILALNRAIHKILDKLKDEDISHK